MTSAAPMAPRYDFHGHPVRRLSYRGALAFIGREVGSALDHEEGGKRFVRDLTTEWSDEIREGVHWHRVKGAELRQIKAQAERGAGSAPPSRTLDLRFANELILLTEEGLNLALMKSGKPLAVEYAPSDVPAGA